MPAGLQPAPFGHSGTDPGCGRGSYRRRRSSPTARTPRVMASFDVVSEVDRQEVRNAVDQAQREIGTRFDFKGTNSSIEQADLVLTLRSVSEDRLTALRQVLEEKLVKRQVSLKGLEYGDVEEATQGTVRQTATIKVGISSDKAREINRLIKEKGPKGVSSQTQGESVRVHEQEARRPAGRHAAASGRPTSASRSSSTTAATDGRHRGRPRLRWRHGLRLPARPARLGVPADRPRPDVDLHEPRRHRVRRRRAAAARRADLPALHDAVLGDRLRADRRRVAASGTSSSPSACCSTSAPGSAAAARAVAATSAERRRDQSSGGASSARFLISSTTPASASVVVSPRLRPSATSRSSRRMILPLRVFGSSGVR